MHNLQVVQSFVSAGDEGYVTNRPRELFLLPSGGNGHWSLVICGLLAGIFSYYDPLGVNYKTQNGEKFMVKAANFLDKDKRARGNKNKPALSLSIQKIADWPKVPLTAWYKQRDKHSCG